MKRKDPGSAADAKGAAATQSTTKTLTPDQARAEYFPAMGRASFYGALRRKEIPSLRVGRRILIPRAGLEKFLDNLMTTRGGNNAA